MLYYRVTLVTFVTKLHAGILPVLDEKEEENKN